MSEPDFSLEDYKEYDEMNAPDAVQDMEDVNLDEKSKEALAALKAELEGHRKKWGGTLIHAHPAMVRQVKENNEYHKLVGEIKKSLSFTFNPRRPVEALKHIMDALALIEDFEEKR